jgi:hypothetical protein
MTRNQKMQNRNMRPWIMVGMTIFVLLIGAHLVAAGAVGASVTAGGRETAGVGSPGSVTGKGGNITNTNLTATTQTSHWQGFWGVVSGSIALRDAAGRRMMNWSVASVSGNVFISNWSTLTWSGYSAPAASACNSIIGAGADSCTNTFDDGTKTFTIGGTAVTNVNLVKTLNGSAAARWDQGIVYDGLSHIFYAATIYSSTRNFKNASMSGFQAIVPVNGTTTRTYYFWAELA